MIALSALAADCLQVGWTVALTLTSRLWAYGRWVGWN